MTAADNINRIKRLVFTSDLMVKSESNTESGYRRFLVDYILEGPTTINYRLTSPYTWPSRDHGDDFTDVAEELPAHRVYTCNNPSGGRLQELISPSPLYELTVRCFAQVWSFAEDRLELIDIPITAGSTYSVKMVFISRSNEIERPDAKNQ